MRNLLKADFHKFFMGKIFITLLILLGAFPLLSYIIYQFLVDPEILRLSGNISDIFIMNLSLFQNYGMLVFIFMIIVLTSDFTQNTVRNKVIMGHSKLKIYLSSLTLNLSISLVLVIAHALLQSAVMGIFVGFDVDWNTIVRAFPLHLLILISFFTLIQLIVFLIRSTGYSILLVFGVIVVGAITISIFSAIGNTTLNDIMTIWFPGAQISFAQLLNISNDTLLFHALLGNAVHIALYVGGAIYLNNKLDYK